jgi:TP901 family phage tail tape measure protein
MADSSISTASIVIKTVYDNTGEKQAKTGLSTLNNVTKNTAQGIVGMMSGVTGLSLSIGGLAFAVNSAVQDFRQFEKATLKVKTLLEDSGGSIKGFENELLKTSSTFGVSASLLAEGMYQYISATQDAQGATQAINQLTKLSIGGFTDLATATEGVAQIMNSYKLEAKELSDVSDILLAVQNKGVTTVDQLARFMFQVIPVAADLGIGLEEVGSQLATITSLGTPTRVATTQLRYLFLELGDTSTDLADKFQKLTGQSFREFIKMGGSVSNALRIIKKDAEETGTDLYTIFSSKEAILGFQQLANNLDMLDTKFAQIQDRAGLTDKAVGEMLQGLDGHIKIFQTSVSNLNKSFVEMNSNWMKGWLSNSSTTLDYLSEMFNEFKNNIEDREILLKLGIDTGWKGKINFIPSLFDMGTTNTVEALEVQKRLVDSLDMVEKNINSVSKGYDDVVEKSEIWNKKTVENAEIFIKNPFSGNNTAIKDTKIIADNFNLTKESIENIQKVIPSFGKGLDDVLDNTKFEILQTQLKAVREFLINPSKVNLADFDTQILKIKIVDKEMQNFEEQAKNTKAKLEELNKTDVKIETDKSLQDFNNFTNELSLFSKEIDKLSKKGSYEFLQGIEEIGKSNKMEMLKRQLSLADLPKEIKKELADSIKNLEEYLKESEKVIKNRLEKQKKYYIDPMGMYKSSESATVYVDSLKDIENQLKQIKKLDSFEEQSVQLTLMQTTLLKFYDMISLSNLPQDVKKNLTSYLDEIKSTVDKAKQEAINIDIGIKTAESNQSYERYQKYLRESEEADFTKTIQGVNKLSLALNNLSNVIDSKTLQSITSLIDTATSISTDYKTLKSKDPNVSMFDKFSAGIGMFSSAVTIFNTVQTLFGTEYVSTAELLNEAGEKFKEAVNKMTVGQQATEQVQKYDKVFNAIADLQGLNPQDVVNLQQITTGTGSPNQTVALGTTQALKGYINALKQSLEELGLEVDDKLFARIEESFKQAAIDGATSGITILEEIAEYVGVSLEELTENIKQSLSIDAVSLASSVSGAFKNVSTDDFVNSFSTSLEDSMTNAIINTLLTTSQFTDIFNQIGNSIFEMLTTGVSTEGIASIKDLIALATEEGKELYQMLVDVGLIKLPEFEGLEIKDTSLKTLKEIRDEYKLTTLEGKEALEFEKEMLENKQKSKLELKAMESSYNYITSQIDEIKKKYPDGIITDEKDAERFKELTERQENLIKDIEEQYDIKIKIDKIDKDILELNKEVTQEIKKQNEEAIKLSNTLAGAIAGALSRGVKQGLSFSEINLGDALIDTLLQSFDYAFEQQLNTLYTDSFEQIGEIAQNIANTLISGNVGEYAKAYEEMFKYVEDTKNILKRYGYTFSEDVSSGIDDNSTVIQETIENIFANAIRNGIERGLNEGFTAQKVMDSIGTDILNAIQNKFLSVFEESFVKNIIDLSAYENTIKNLSKQGDITGAYDYMQESLKFITEQLKGLGFGFEDLTKTVNEFNAEFSNVPSGFKIARAIYEAQTPVQMAMGSMTNTPNNSTVIIQNDFNNAQIYGINDLENKIAETVDKITMQNGIVTYGGGRI